VVHPKVGSEADPSVHPGWACVDEAGLAEGEGEAVCSFRTEVSLKFVLLSDSSLIGYTLFALVPPPIPVRPASPLPPGVPTGPRNQNRYKDRDGNAPAVDGLDYGGTQGGSGSLDSDERSNSRYVIYLALVHMMINLGQKTARIPKSG
jgi:hypothetical protein